MAQEEKSEGAKKRAVFISNVFTKKILGDKRSGHTNSMLLLVEHSDSKIEIELEHNLSIVSPELQTVESETRMPNRSEM